MNRTVAVSIGSQFVYENKISLQNWWITVEIIIAVCFISCALPFALWVRQIKIIFLKESQTSFSIVIEEKSFDWLKLFIQLLRIIIMKNFEITNHVKCDITYLIAYDK